MKTMEDCPEYQEDLAKMEEETSKMLSILEFIKWRRLCSPCIQEQKEEEKSDDNEKPNKSQSSNGT